MLLLALLLVLLLVLLTFLFARPSRPKAKNRALTDFLKDPTITVASGDATKSAGAAAASAAAAVQKLLRDAYEFAPLPSASADNPEDPATTRPLHVLVMFATEYGFSKEVARKTAQFLAELYHPTSPHRPFAPRVLNVADFRLADFAKEHIVLLITSTTGDGVVPNDAREFMEHLDGHNVAGWTFPAGTATPEPGPDASDVPTSALDEVGKRAPRFSVLALGDQGYPHFCKAGIMFEQAFSREAGGVASWVPRVNVDQEDWTAIDGWMAQVKKALLAFYDENVVGNEQKIADDYLEDSIRNRGSASNKPKYSRDNPYLAPMTVKRLITQIGHAGDKETIHVEFDISGATGDLDYVPGDALGVVPQNNPEEVDDLIAVLRVPATQPVMVPGKEQAVPLREALLNFYDLKAVKPDLIALMADNASLPQEKARALSLLEGTRATAGLSASIQAKSDTNPVPKSDDEEVHANTNGDAPNGLPEESPKPEHPVVHQAELRNEQLSKYISQREVRDVLADFPSAKPGIEHILNQMRTLAPRYYSISSSQTYEKNIVSITAAVVRYSLLDKPRTGVATTFMQDRTNVGEKVPIFINKNNQFRLPKDPVKPILMVGPGTGLAPFRAFLQERSLSLVPTGKNILFFGSRYEKRDFLYADELREYEAKNQVELFLAFSRDQKQKVYVQDRIREQSKLVWKVMEDGGHLYVCGDATYMAVDVHQAFLEVIQKEGQKSKEEAEKYMDDLENAHRYQRDVWVS